MPRIVAIELCELDLPFRHAFRHAAASRARSESLFLRIMTDGGHLGYGETLPRPYVTGETREASFDLLARAILPRLLGLGFGAFDEVRDFLARCDGKAPGTWVDAETAQTAAWCAVDLALLDTFGRAFGVDLGRGLPAGSATAPSGEWPEGLRYGLVLSEDPWRRQLVTLLEARLFGLHDVKVKVSGQSLGGVRLARRVLGARARVRLDANMGWSVDEARAAIAALGRARVDTVEQPVAARDVEGMARLFAAGVPVVADESCHDAGSLERLIAARACRGVNVRIVKCGGLIAALARARRALQAGLTLQIGCQVGESSLLSAAQLALVRTLGGGVSYVEGCYGERLLARDPLRPLLQFGRGGRPPRAPAGPGLGMELDPAAVARHVGRRFSLGASLPHLSSKESP
jgi:L-alanine-DL-glutamate epimerase-like enolase superfamily enzyme